MIGLVHKSISAAAVKVLSLGPVASGLVIRGVWVLASSGNVVVAEFAVAVCRAPVESLADLQAGRSLVYSSDFINPNLGIPAVAFTMAAGFGHQGVLPFYEYVGAGPVYIGLGGYSTSAFRLTAGLVVEGGRSGVLEAIPALASAGIAAGQNVLESLRASAEAARGG